MSQEMKSIDARNEEADEIVSAFHCFGWNLKSSQRVFSRDTRADGAVTYQGVTYIHSTTDTVDYTRLVFERMTDMPHYDELCELEEEFWELCEQTAGGRPYVPPHADTMEKWARHFEPDLRSSEEKKRLHIFYGILTGIVFLVLASVMHVFYELSTMLSAVLMLGMGTLALTWFLRCKAAKHRALKKALRTSSSVYRTRLEELYGGIMRECKQYDKSLARMRSIINMADHLLD